MKDIETKIKIPSSIIGERLNAYYLPEFRICLMRICRKFPIWTNTMTKFFNSPYTTATSASVEGEFSQLKNSILCHESRLISADRFVVLHLWNLENSMKLVRSDQLYSNTNNIEDLKNFCSFSKTRNTYVEKSTSPKIDDNYKNAISSSESSFSSDDTLNKEERWGGLKNLKTGPFQKSQDKEKTCENIFLNDDQVKQISPILKKRRTKYLEPCPEINRILNKTHTRSSKNIMLKNGNLTTPCNYKNKKYIVSNTCAFDSLVFGITIGYTDFPSYRSYIQLSKNNFLNFIQEIIYHGTSTKIYNYRLELLTTMFKSTSCIDNVELLNAECNISLIIQGLMKEDPSCIEDISCTNDKCRNFKKSRTSPTIILSPADGLRIITDGISSLGEILTMYIKTTPEICMLPYNKKLCRGQKTIKRTLKTHIFIELDALSYEKNNIISCELTEIPVSIDLYNEQ